MKTMYVRCWGCGTPLLGCDSYNSEGREIWRHVGKDGRLEQPPGTSPISCPKCPVVFTFDKMWYLPPTPEQKARVSA